ncbi:hypothetical protein BDR03DRAFT_1012530 [Suillus americanus]|nr:hypothetical protein BDR03DRAFT_1012530 [Suillus americanus]
MASEYSIKISDVKTGELVATLKGHTWALAVTQTRNTTKWEQTAVLVEHTDWAFALAISSHGIGRILASSSSLHKAAPTPQNREEAHFFVTYSTAAPSRSKPFCNGADKVVKVSSCKGTAKLSRFHMRRRNAPASEVALAKQKQKMKVSHSTNSTASSSRPPKSNATQPSGTANQTPPSSQPQLAVSNSSTTPGVGGNAAATSSMPSRPDVMLRQAGLWTRFWLLAFHWLSVLYDFLVPYDNFLRASRI